MGVAIVNVATLVGLDYLVGLVLRRLWIGDARIIMETVWRFITEKYKNTNTAAELFL